jgi:hypothetical protein
VEYTKTFVNNKIDTSTPKYNTYSILDDKKYWILAKDSTTSFVLKFDMEEIKRIKKIRETNKMIQMAMCR